MPQLEVFGSPPKRRKTLGLNSRFDRMIERVNSSLYASTTSPQTRKRTRSRSSASSSVSSYDPPKTPLKTHNGLGDTFCVLKMKGARGKKRSPFDSVSRTDDSDSSSPHSGITPLVVQTESLPDWLSTTLLKLPPRDPLRILLPTPLLFTHSPRTKDCQFFDPAPMLSDQTELTPVEPNLDNASSMDTLVPHGAGTHFALPEEWNKTNTVSVHRSLSWNNPATNWGLPNAINDGLEHDKSFEATLPVHPALSAIVRQLPFSTPGPSSTVTLHYPNHRTSSTLEPLNNHADPSLSASVNGPLMQPTLEKNISSSDVHSPSPRFAFLPASSPQHGTHAAKESGVNSLLNSEQSDSLPITRASDPWISPSPVIQELPKFPSAAQPVLASSQSLGHDNRSNLYATPGLRYQVQVPVSQAVYFDLPTEDPSESDPPEGYKVPIDGLHFKWEPYFTAKEYSTQQFVHSKSSMGEIPLKESELHVEDRRLYSDASNSDGSLHQVTDDKSPKFWAMQSHSSGGDHENLIVDTQPDEVAFAPAPGIYISPLRNAPPYPELRQDSGLSELRPPTSLPYTPKRQVSRASTSFIRSTEEDPDLGCNARQTVLNISPIRASSPIVSRTAGANSRGIYTNIDWRVRRECSVTASKPAGNEDGTLGINSPSQVSNDSIESWAEA